jgi:type 1 glutamine amidotransferase
LRSGTSFAFAQTPDSSIHRRAGDPPHTVLALGDVSTSAQQHDSVSHALSTIEALGLREGLFGTVIRTDTQLVTRGAIAAATGTLTYYKNLDDFDAVVLFVEGNPPLTLRQQADLIAFLQSGKGLVAIHTAVCAFHAWPEFRDILGIAGRGRLTEPSSDAEIEIAGTASLFPKPFHIRDRLVPLSLNKSARVLAASAGSPAVWTNRYGKGRVFVSQLGHYDAVWDRDDVQHMILEGVRWAIGNSGTHKTEEKNAAAQRRTGRTDRRVY